MLVYQRLTHKSHGNLQISGELREVQLFRFLKQHVEACRVRHPPEAMAVTWRSSSQYWTCWLNLFISARFLLNMFNLYKYIYKYVMYIYNMFIYIIIYIHIYIYILYIYYIYMLIYMIIFIYDYIYNMYIYNYIHIYDYIYIHIYIYIWLYICDYIAI